MNTDVALEGMRQHVTRTPEKIRSLSAQELGLDGPSGRVEEPNRLYVAAEARVAEPIDDDIAPLLEDVELLLGDGFAGVIFTGPPGTSKSWFASKIALHLADGFDERIRFVQFHPSYQYEDFVEGLVPVPGGTFQWQNKHLLLLSERAELLPDHRFVLVIDELSRADPSRVFGEALTYIETSKRGVPFRLASGREASIPSNLIVLATMNPLDRGVDEIDTALERRFAMIQMNPDSRILEALLTTNQVDYQLKHRIIRFFERVQRRDNPLTMLGHAYFRSVRDEASLTRLWDYQLRHFFERAYRFDREKLMEVQREWRRVLEPPSD